MKKIFFILFFVGVQFSFSQEVISPETIVQKQVEAYNNKDIEAFLETYSDDIEIYNFPNSLIMKGKEEMRDVYSEMFDSVKELHCEIKKRIIINNKVIDHEYVKFDDNFSTVVAIYEVKNDKIIKVTFVR